MKPTVLVTGGTGFLGKNFITYLKNKNRFSIYSLSKKKIKKNFQQKNVKYIFCDISNKKQLKKKLHHNFNYIVNFAGHINHKNLNKTYETHYLGLKNLVDIFEDKNIIKFIQIGSSVEYGFLESPQKEEQFVQAKSLKSMYGKSKLLSTEYIMKKFKLKNFPAIVIRPYLVYGPGQSADRLIPITISNCLKDYSFKCSSGEQKRNFMFIDDFVKIVYKSLFSKLTGQILNVGSVKNYKVKFVISNINKLIGMGRPLYGRIKMRRDEPMNLYPSLKKLKKISIKKETAIIDGLKKTISYYKSV